MIEAPASAEFPFSIGHGVGVVVDGDGKVEAVFEFFFEKDVSPTGDVGEIVDAAGLEVDEARHAGSDGGDVGKADLVLADGAGDVVDEGRGIQIIRSRDGR